MANRPFYALRNQQAYPGSTVYVWSPTGQLAELLSLYTADSGLILRQPTWYQFLNAEANHHVLCVDIALGIATSTTYHVTWTDPLHPLVTLSLAIHVVDDPTTINPITIPSGSSQSDIQDAINNGYNPINLNGDTVCINSFDLSGPSVAPIVTLDGGNWASLTAAPALGSNPMFKVQGPLNLKRLAFYGSDPVGLSHKVLGSVSHAHVDINVTRCRFDQISLGASYLPDGSVGYDPDDGTTDASGNGIVLERCDFIRATTGPIAVGTVFNMCRFMESADYSDTHAFWNINSTKWLVMNCDWMRTARGIVMQGLPVRNGVVAACRFWDIALGVDNGGEIILMENADGYEDTMSNNAFVLTHAFGSIGAGVALAGSGIHDNFFRYMDLQTMAVSISIVGNRDVEHAPGPFTLVKNNHFEHIQMSAFLHVDGHCSNNTFNHMVGLRYPLQTGDVGNVQRLLAEDMKGIPQFWDTSTYDAGAGESPNVYKNLYLSSPDIPVKVNSFPNITFD